MRRHRDNIHADQMGIRGKMEENVVEHQQIKEQVEKVAEEVTDLDIVTDYYNRLIIELSQQREKSVQI